VPTDGVALCALTAWHGGALQVMTTVVVIMTGSLMRLSLVKRFDSPQPWLRRFYLPLLVLVFLPLYNFYDFLRLASRVVRILWHYCDERISIEHVTLALGPTLTAPTLARAHAAQPARSVKSCM
jgi:hypothetical protein